MLVGTSLFGISHSRYFGIIFSILPNTEDFMRLSFVLCGMFSACLIVMNSADIRAIRGHLQRSL